MREILSETQENDPETGVFHVSVNVIGNIFIAETWVYEPETGNSKLFPSR